MNGISGALTVKHIAGQIILVGSGLVVYVAMVVFLSEMWYAKHTSSVL